MRAPAPENYTLKSGPEHPVTLSMTTDLFRALAGRLAVMVAATVVLIVLAGSAAMSRPAPAESRPGRMACVDPHASEPAWVRCS